MTEYSTMPKDDLMLALQKLQDEYQFFLHADRSFSDPRETKKRLACEKELREVRTEINRRKQIGQEALAKLNQEGGHAR